MLSPPQPRPVSATLLCTASEMNVLCVLPENGFRFWPLCSWQGYAFQRNHYSAFVFFDSKYMKEKKEQSNFIIRTECFGWNVVICFYFSFDISSSSISWRKFSTGEPSHVLSCSSTITSESYSPFFIKVQFCLMELLKIDLLACM